MARDVDGIIQTKFANSGDVGLGGLDLNELWTISYSTPGGAFPQRIQFNQLFRYLSALAVEINQGGPFLEYDATIDYAVNASVKGSDGAFYKCLISNGPSSSVVDPVGDVSGTWDNFLNIVDDTTPQLGGTLDTNSKMVQFSQGTDVASASALAITQTGNVFNVTGTTDIDSINTSGKVGNFIILKFAGILTLNNSADLLLPSGSDITTAANDFAIFVEYATGQWQLVNYQRYSGQPLLPAKTVQHVYTQTGSFSSTTAQIPTDDTIPQNTEGAEVMTVSITPESASNTLRVEYQCNLGSASGSLISISAALFRDSESDALAVSKFYFDGRAETLTGLVDIVAGSTAATTFKIRVGDDAGSTTYLNGDVGGTRIFGGKFISSLSVTEYRP